MGGFVNFVENRISVLYRDAAILLFRRNIMIIAQDIRKSYGQLEILKGISLSIGAGEVVSVVGASGAGKTTLLQILGTLDRADSGSLTIDGVEVSSLSEAALAELRNKSIGFVFQNHQLLPEFTALENVCVPALIAGGSLRELRPRAEALLSMLGVGGRSGHKPSELSGGECQRVAVARALMNKPKVIFADEPSGSLDSRNKEELHQLFFDLRAELQQTFVLVTHDTSLAQRADRILHIADGIII